MAKFVFVYYGGVNGDRAEVTEAWTNWFGELGSKVIDPGNPFNDGGKVVHADGVMDPKDSPATGYSIVSASNIDEAIEIAKGCPLTGSETGAVGVYEALPM